MSDPSSEATNRSTVNLTETVSLDDPVARYTPTNPIPEKETVKEYVSNLSYQHDPVTAIHLAWVLREMPDYMKDFPYFGVPLSQAASLIDKHPELQQSRCQLTVGLALDSEYIQTISDAPDLDTDDKEIQLTDFHNLIANAQSSVDHLFTDVGVFAFQYRDQTVTDSNHTVLYVDDPEQYDFFIAFQDQFAYDELRGGQTFQELDAVTFTDTIAGLLHLKAKMLVDSHRSPKVDEVYQERFVQPLFSAFGAAREQHERPSPD